MLRSLLQRLRYTLHPPRVCFVYHPNYARAISGVPLDPARADEILAFLAEHRLIRRGDVSRPLPASLENILRVHTPAYLESLQQPDTIAHILGVPVREDEVEGILDLQRLIAGGTIQATRMAFATGRAAVNLGGGFHHAAPDRGMGFCIFNDVAVAIARLRARGYAAPVLVVDLDLHDANGTRAAFARDPTVYTFSIHNAPWDDLEAVASTNITLGSAVTDEVYLDALRRTLPLVVRAHRPGLVIYVAGTDPAADDRIGDWEITSAGMLTRDQFVIQEVRGLGPDARLVVVLGGGYGPAAWRYSARFLSWLASGGGRGGGGWVVEPPDELETTLRRFRQIVRELGEGSLIAEPGSRGGDDDWGLTEEDLGGLVPGAARARKVLGRYSKHGVELLLERSGFFAQIRARGFRHPVLDIDFASATGQTLRIWGEPDRAELLMELRIDRNRRAVPGMEVLYVEWLVLQNPRQGFGGPVAQLPGQEHPGLGLLGEVGGWLVVMCETLGLDGIAFTPAHYYMAVLGRHYLRFLEPRHQARFEALRDAVAGCSLPEANRMIDEGRVVDAESGEAVCWEAAPMVVPVSARLRALTGGKAYEEAVRRERARLKFRREPAPAPS